jgi:hypothetical protein
MMPESTQAFAVGRHSMVSKESADHLAQPLSLFWNGMMHPSPQFNLYFPQLRPHPVSARFPFELESPLAVLSADVSESEKIKAQLKTNVDFRLTV